jgi:hypothetical protein
MGGLSTTVASFVALHAQGAMLMNSHQITNAKMIKGHSAVANMSHREHENAPQEGWEHGL